MASSLDSALQRALAIRINLQMILSKLPVVEEWMDIHLDRWLEHIPMPMEMPDGAMVSYSTMVGSDLRRLAWLAWGHPLGFVPRMADYFKLCNIAKSDVAILDQVGETLDPVATGSWIGVWGKKVTTGWHFPNPQSWTKVEALFGTHEAKFQLKKFMEIAGATEIEKFTQSIGENVFTEVEVKLAGDSVAAQLHLASQGMMHFTGNPLSDDLRGRLCDMARDSASRISFFVRIRGGKIARVAVNVPTGAHNDIALLCSSAQVGCDPQLLPIVGALGNRLTAIEYGRAGEHAGVDVFVEPTEPVLKGSPAATTPTSSAN
jgi:hypothetical protein